MTSDEPAFGDGRDASRGEYVVEGHVRRAGRDGAVGEPAGGVVVRAFDQGIDGAALLGEATTDVDGSYSIAFPGIAYAAGRRTHERQDPMRLLRAEPAPAEPAPAEADKDGPDLWVAVPGDGQSFLARSETMFDAERRTTIDLELPDAPPAGSEFERLTGVLVPRLAGVSLAELTADQVEVLGEDARTPREQVEAAVGAARAVREAEELAARRGIAVDDLELPLFSALYAAHRAEPDTDLTYLLARDGSWWSAAVLDAAREGRIPEPSDGSVDRLVGLVTSLRRARQLEPAAPGSAATLGDLLGTMPAGQQLAEDDRTMLSTLVGPGPADLGALRTSLLDRGWEDPKVNSVIRTIGLGDVTANHPPLVEALQRPDPDDGAAALADLAGYGRADWSRLVALHGVPDHLDMTAGRPDLYVDLVLRNVELRMPSAYLRARVADGRIPVPEPVSGAVIRFLDNATTFRLGDHPVLGRFVTPEADDLAGIADEDVPGVQAELLRIERLTRVSPSLEVAQDLLAAGYSSARQISLMHRRRFVDELTDVLPGGADAAEDVHRRAAAAVSTATALLLSRAPVFNRTPGLPVLPTVPDTGGDGPGTVRSALLAGAQTATLDALFGSQDYCACDSCASMYSPAAYLVELLQMLDGGPKNAAGASALDVLLQRRPDLGEVELTCDNTDVVVPYVDLVLEILESVLAEDSPLNSFARGARGADGGIEDWGFDPELDQGRLPRQLHDDLAQAGIDVGDDPTVTTRVPVATGRRWSVSGDGWRLHLNGGVNPARLRVTLYPQSKALTSGDDAIPRLYVHWVYEPLRMARYPWVFPFSLDEAETEAWLDRLGTRRREIADTYAGPARWSTLDNACAVLGIEEAERRRLMLATTDSWLDWDFPDERVRAEDGSSHQWFVDLRVVSRFRHRARISHRELLELLDTRFVQSAPGLAAPLVLSGDECDSDLMFVGDSPPGGRLTPSVLRRVHLFVRLACRLGWTFRDLDSAIEAHGRATDPVTVSEPRANSTEERYTESFLVYLSNVVRLRESTTLPVEAAVNLFRSKLDTRRYWDQSGSQPRPTPSYYERLLNDPVVARPRAAGLELATDRDELAPLPPGGQFPRLRLSDYTSELAAALSCRRSDVSAVLGPAGTSVPPTNLGAGGVVAGAGDWVDVSGADSARVEWVVGRPSDAATQVRVTVQEQDATGAPVDVGAPVVAGRGAGDWRRAVVAYAGPADRVRVRVERAAGTGTTWVTARVLTGAGLVDDVLTLTTLSRLCGHLRLARAAKLATADYVALVQMSGIAPLDDPASALGLLDAARRSRAAGPTIAQLDVLLRHRYASAADAEQAQRTLGGLLTACREKLRTEETALTATAENSVALARQLLLELGWPDRLVDLTLGAGFLDRTFPAVQGAPLDTLADAVVGVLPPGLAFSAGTRRLEWSAAPRSSSASLAAAVTVLRATPEYAALAAGEKVALDGALAEIAAATARTGQELADTLDPLVRLAKSLRLPVHRVSYLATAVPAPTAIPIPPEWSGTFWWNSATATWQFLGPMTAAWRDTVAEFGATPPGSAYRQAVDALYAAASTFQETGANRLVTREAIPPLAGDLTAELLLGQLATAADRCLRLLNRIVPVVREQRATSIIQQLIADAFDLDPAQAAVLLARFRHTEDGVSRTLVARDVEQSWLLAPSFARSDPAVAVVPAAFPAQFRTVERLSKLALIAARGALRPGEMEWLFGGWDTARGLFDFTLLPQRAVAGTAPMWSQWLGLATLLGTGAGTPAGRRGDLESIRGILAGPGGDPLRYGALAALLGLPPDDVSRLAADLGAATAADLLQPAVLLALLGCADLLRRTGADAATLDGWRRPATMVGATRARQLARAAIGGLHWATAAQPVFDRLRIRRRDVLTEFWVQRTGVRDADDLYGELLVDPQMGQCALTSRVRQAISSVQLFIHRIVLNLEPDVRTDAVDESHWAWMRNYRVWEANRKILLYPENWIEPDLRADQTAPFRALTTELLQGDVTDDAAEEALRTYVDGLGDIGRIEAVGLCNEYDSSTAPALTSAHVFGRTRHEPYAYYYRRFTRHAAGGRNDPTGTWTPWEQIAVDVEGDHLVPFVWRGRLFVCWPILGEQAVAPTQANTTGTTERPRKLWTMKVAWSERRHGTWTARRLFGGDALLQARLQVEDWDRRAFYLRPSVQDQGVALNVYLNPGIVQRTDTIQSKIHLDQVPIATLDFDGEEMRMAAAILRYWLGSPATDQFFYIAVVPAEDPISVDTTTSITGHEAMTIAAPAGSLILPYGKIAIPTVTALTGTPRRYRVLLPADEPVLQFRAPRFLSNSPDPALPFFFADSQRQFFMYPTHRLVVSMSPPPPPMIASIEDKPELHVTAVDIPQLVRFRTILHRSGIDGLLAAATQTEPDPPAGVRGTFAAYHPDPSVVATQPLDDVVFSPTEPAGPYNWELFFHVALAAGAALTRNHRFAQARRWFHYVFDPTDSSGGPTPDRYWRFRPFREPGAGPPISELLRRLADPADHSPEKQALLTTIAEWRDNPFEPHVVARLRPRAYMYSVVMKYLDNLIAWADQLFRRDTMEALDEATQLYVLAAQILGRRPEAIPHRTRPRARSFADLRAELRGDAGALGNPLVTAENLAGAGGTAGTPTGPLPQTLYFCVPGNPKLLEYYDTVEDRLTKLRNCMNIDGVVRRLALFDPPIDPGLLVRARAAGVDLSAVLADANAPLPLYRFSVMSRTASELCAQVCELGGALLAALEKRDGEALARLRNQHERSLLDSVRQVKQLQVEEARASLEALGPVLENAQSRLAYYVGLVSQLEDVSIPGGPAGPTIASIASAAVETVSTSLGLTQTLLAPIDPISTAATELLQQALARATELIGADVPETGGATAKVPMNAAEKRHLDELRLARDDQAHGTDLKAAARVFAMIPDFTLGTSGAAGSPVVTAQLGGTLLSKAAELFATQADGAAAEHTYRANLASILAGYQRRAADWVQQASIAGRDIEQATKQVAAAALRASITAQDLRNHDLQASNATELDEFMRTKFSSQELYTWVVQQTSDVHFRSYQLTYDVAKRAEQAYGHELGLDSTDFIRFGYWDSLRRGLTAGEQLLHDIKRMETSYLAENRRELEIVKHVSLRQLDGAALLRLRSGGTCEFELPEALFDLDFPGHYFRRIKSVGVSVPCVVGPYTGVNGTLTLLASSVRTKSVVVGSYDAAENYATSRVPIQSVATSSGQNDSGLFELGLHDDRYLPFEGAGALSRWRLSLPGDFRAFDYATITDIVLHLRYTARDGGELLATKARQTLADRLGALTRAQSTQVGLVQLIPLRLDFAREWQRFRNDHAKLALQLSEQHFPYMFRGRITPHGAALVWDGESPGVAVDEVTVPDVPLPAYELEWAADSPLLDASDPYLLVAYHV
jgi:hypothetical protein